MLNGKDGVRPGDCRVNDLNDAGVRRRWSAADKARVVADSFAPGIGASEAARRWQVGRRQVYAWRRAAQAGLLPPEPAFVPIVAEPAPAATALPVRPASAAMLAAIEVEVAGAVVRVPPGLDDGLLARVLRAVRASAVGA